MTISIECSCGKKLKAPPTLQGKTVPCPNCKAPITVPVAANQGEHHPATEPPPSPPATAAEILMQCQCGQQFKVAAQYAGHQVNCPGCQVLCQIPHNTAVSVPTVSPAPPQIPEPQPAPSSGYPQPNQTDNYNPGFPQQSSPENPQQAYPQQGHPQQAYPQQAYPQQAYPQQGYPQQGHPPAPYPEATGYETQSYGQPQGLGMQMRPAKSEKTGLGIFIFAIATCVFSGGLLLMLIWELVGHVNGVSSSMKAARISSLREKSEEIRKELFSSRGDSTRRQELSKQMSDISKEMSEISSSSGGSGFGNLRRSESFAALLKIGTILQLLSLIAIVVGAVFSIMSNSRLVGLAIATVCVSGVGFLLSLIFQSIPLLQEGSLPKSFLYCAMIPRMFEVTDIILTWLVDGGVVAIFLLYSIFLMKAAEIKRARTTQSGAKNALVSFIVCASAQLLLMIWCLIDFSTASLWPLFLGWIIHWIVNAAMVVGLVFLLINLFGIKRHYRV